MSTSYSASIHVGLQAAKMFHDMDSPEAVTEWLSALNMEVYTDAFRKHSVTGSLLLSLTPTELRRTLGVKNIRDRRAIIDAVCYLKEALSVATRTVIPEDGRILTHLSNERIFLAWVRLALILQTTAVATIRLTNLTEQTNLIPVQATSSLLACLSALTLLYGGIRYYRMHALVEQPGRHHLPSNLELLSPLVFVAIGAVIILYSRTAAATEDAAVLALLSL